MKWWVINLSFYLQIVAKCSWRYFDKQVCECHGQSWKWLYWYPTIAVWIVVNWFLFKAAKGICERQRLFFFIIAFSDVVKVIFLTDEQFLINDFVFMIVAFGVSVNYKPDRK